MPTPEKEREEKSLTPHTPRPLPDRLFVAVTGVLSQRGIRLEYGTECALEQVISQTLEEWGEGEE